MWDDADRRPGAPVDGPAASIQSLAALLDALVAGDSDRALAIALAASKRGAGTVEMIDSYLAPALLTIGRGWQQGELSIFQEHRASGIARRILIEDDRAVTVPKGRAITAVLSGDAHSLPSDMAAHALRDDGWHVDHLGTQTPPQELIDNLEPTDTDLVVLSPTMPANRALSFTTAARLRERGLTVLVGSPGTPVAKLQRQAAEVWDGIDQGLRRGQRPSRRRRTRQEPAPQLPAGEPSTQTAPTGTVASPSSTSS